MGHRTELPNGNRLIAIEDIEPELAGLVDELDLACMHYDEYPGCIDESTYHHLEEYAVLELGIRDAETPEWVKAAVEARPGTWTARLCRAMHGQPETYEAIVHCGLCAQYASSRKRYRAARLPSQTLPGFEEIGGGYQLRPPCSKRGLTWLRKLIYRMRDREQVETRREHIPDLRQGRGWDWGTRIYPGNK